MAMLFFFCRFMDDFTVSNLDLVLSVIARRTKVIPLCYLPSSPQGIVTNTCPALPMCIGRPGRLGNVAMCPVAEASNPDAEPVRMATTVQGVVRYVKQNNITHAMLCYLLSSLAAHC